MFVIKGVSFKGVSFDFHGKRLFLCKRLISTVEVYFYSGGIFLRRGRHISTAEVYPYEESVYFYERGQFKSNQLIICMEERNHSNAHADEFLCRNCVILKCEAVAQVGHRW